MSSEPMPAEPLRAAVMRNVSVRFGSVHALNAVSFDVPAGLVTGLIGRNGAGKTTAIQVLAGLLEPDSGAAEVLGLRPVQDPERMLRRTGYLLSEPSLFSYLTPRETLEFVAEAYGLSRDVAVGRGEDLLRFFELEESADRLVAGFSTGMLKRLGLACALIHAPTLLILDEPFESLDPLMVRRLRRLLLACSHAGNSVLVSSHLLAELAGMCAHAVIMDRGRVLYEGSPPTGAEPDAGRGATLLEDLYATLVDEAAAPHPSWLLNKEP